MTDTYYVNLRGGGWGAVCTPYLLEGDPLAAAPKIVSFDGSAVPSLVQNRSVLLVSHGFNVTYDSGLILNSRIVEQLKPITEVEIVFGVLWPGDWAVPAINYPFEDSIASQAGKFLGQFCNQYMAGASSLAFASHSLGARVILEAIKASKRRVRVAAIEAGAVGSKCLTEEFAAADANCDKILTLASREDMVLEWAYPAGDFFGDILFPDHSQFDPALGRGGPASPVPANVSPHQIPDACNYGHHNYFPPGDTDPLPPPAQQTWVKTIDFIDKAFRGKAPVWP